MFFVETHDDAGFLEMQAENPGEGFGAAWDADTKLEWGQVFDDRLLVEFAADTVGHSHGKVSCSDRPTAVDSRTVGLVGRPRRAILRWLERSEAAGTTDVRVHPIW
jgi:hypothetical protein